MASRHAGDHRGAQPRLATQPSELEAGPALRLLGPQPGLDPLIAASGW